MKTPTTVKGYLKLLLQICSDSSLDLKNVTEDESRFIGEIRAGIQNDMGEDKLGVLAKHNLNW